MLVAKRKAGQKIEIVDGDVRVVIVFLHGEHDGVRRTAVFEIHSDKPIDVAVHGPEHYVWEDPL